LYEEENIKIWPTREKERRKTNKIIDQSKDIVVGTEMDNEANVPS
jgi:hypothetical protein